MTFYFIRLKQQLLSEVRHVTSIKIKDLFNTRTEHKRRRNMTVAFAFPGGHVLQLIWSSSPLSHEQYKNWFRLTIKYLT